MNDKNYLKAMNNKTDEVKKQYALPVYNMDQIDNIPDDEIQFVINDQFILEDFQNYKKKSASTFASVLPRARSIMVK